MPNYAQIQIIGHAGRDAEVKKVGADTVANFSVAVKDGKDSTTWYDVSVWGKSAESYVGPYLKKGNAVFVAGTPKLEEYTKKDGTTASKLKINANSYGGVQILTSKEANGEAAAKKHDPQTPLPSKPATAEAFADEIPFMAHEAFILA